MELNTSKDQSNSEINLDTALALLQSEDRYVRWQAVHRLGELGIGKKHTVEALIQVLKDEDSSVRIETISALAQLGSQEAVDPLIQALKDEDWMVRRSAADALGQLANPLAVIPLTKALEDEDADVQEHAATSLGLLGDKRAVTPLIDAIRYGESEVITYAAAALSKLGEDTIAILLELLKDSTSKVREHAAYVLYDYFDERAIEPLFQALYDDEEAVGQWITADLSKYGEKIVPKLLILLGQQNPIVRCRTIEILGRLKDPIFFNSIVEFLNDVADIVRAAVAWALGELDDARAIEPLLTYLKDQNNVVRFRAAEALGKVGDASALPALEWALQNDKGKGQRGSTVKEAAAEAIKNIQARQNS